jgi:hypothetical protein
VSSNIEIKVAEYEDEVVLLSPLIKKFFNEAHPVYTEDELYRALLKDLRNDTGILAYVTVDGKPVAYCYSILIEDLTGYAVMVAQGYSSKPFFMRKLRKTIDDWTRKLGITKQIFLARPDLQHYYEMQFGCKLQLLYMTRILEPEIKVESEVKENVPTESARTS